MDSLDAFARGKLDALEAGSLRRRLTPTERGPGAAAVRGGRTLVSFSCNDYLGLSHHSRVIAAAQAVPGVESAEVTTFQRLYEGPNGELEAGFLPLGPLEIARLDNDPRFPGNGRLKPTMGGGR